MNRLILLSLALLSFRPVAAESALASAHRAAARLGENVWSRVLEIENRSRRNAYPATVHATVFELGGILWFYSPVNGTQSLSLHRGRVAAEKADLAPLLRAIEPGFAKFTVLPPDAARPADTGEPLPNGCFIDSFAALRERLRDGEAVEQARLLSFYVQRSGRLLGHTVLTYRTPDGVFVLDPAASALRAHRLAGVTLDQPAEIAQRARPDLRIAQARWVPGEYRRTFAGGSAMRYARADEWR